MDAANVRQQEADRFRNQFPVPVVLSDDVRGMLELEMVAFGIPVYRCLNRLFIRDADGQFYGAY